MTCRKANQLTSKPDSVVDPGQLQALPAYGLKGVRCRGYMILIQALMWNVGTCWLNVKGRGVMLFNFASTDVSQRGGATRSSDEDAVMALERRGCVIQPSAIANH
jgi:hypothetical protein